MNIARFHWWQYAKRLRTGTGTQSGAVAIAKNSKAFLGIGEEDYEGSLVACLSFGAVLTSELV